MDYEYEHSDEYAPRILWGRIAFFGIALLLVFVAGYCVAPSGADPAEVDRLNTQVTALESDNETLQQQVDAAQDSSGGGEGGGGGGGGDGGGGDGDGEAEPEETEEPADQEPVEDGDQTYVVEENDTLAGIALEFYGDATKYTLIADANNLEGELLEEGQELVIPPDPDAEE